MSNESFTSQVRRAERRVGRPFLALYQREVMAHTLRKLGLRVSREEYPGPILVWELSFGREGEDLTFVYERTIEDAFAIAVNPPKEIALKKKRKHARRVW